MSLAPAEHNKVLNNFISQWSLMGKVGDFPPSQGHMAMSGDIQQCIKNARNATKHPMVHRTVAPSQSKIYLGQNINSAKVVAESKN